MELNRRDKILKLIVEHFIKTAQPVGSNTLIQEFNLDYSSATIRNEMQSLEEAGYLEKTHTSSGRVPSSAGYKYYIENLRHSDVDDRIKYGLQTILQQKNKSIEDVLKESCAILADMTNLASVVLGPQGEEETLVSIQIIPLSQNSATAVFVTSKGYVENKTFVFENEVSVNDLKKCMELMNDRLKDTPISNIVDKMTLIKPLIADYVKENDIIYQAIAQVFLRFATDRIDTFGETKLFEQPEFASDSQKLKKILELLENPDELRNLKMDGKTGEVDVKIGDLKEGLDDASIVRTQINIPGKEGTIAIVGPKRMDYDAVVSALGYVAEELNKYFATNDESEDDDEDVRQEKPRNN